LPSLLLKGSFFIKEDAMLCYKDSELYGQLQKCTHRMQAIVFAFNGFCELYLQRCPVITSVFRKNPEPPALPSLHAIWRAVDIRAKDWTNEDISAIESFINNIFKGKKPACYVHQTDVTNRDTLHFHLQDAS